MVLYLSVNFEAALKAVSSIFRCLIAKILTPYFLLILLKTMLGKDVNIFMISAILLNLTAFFTGASN